MNNHNLILWRRPSVNSMIATAVVAVSVTLLFACTTTPEPSVRDAMQGKWSGTWTSVTKVGTNGVKCVNGKISSWEVVGSKLGGKATSDYGDVYDGSATVSETGAIKGGLAVAGQSVVKFWGKTSADGLFSKGEFEDTEKCKGTWKTAKV